MPAFFHRNSDSRHNAIRFAGLIPELFGLHWPVVGAFNVAIPALEYSIVEADKDAETFKIAGDHTRDFAVGTGFTVSGSAGGTNDGTYTVTDVDLDGNGDTIITVANVPADDTTGKVKPHTYARKAVAGVSTCVYLGGIQQFVNSGGAACTVTLYDGDPTDADSQAIGSWSVNNGTFGNYDIGSHVLFTRYALWYQVSGVIPTGTLRLLLNY